MTSIEILVSEQMDGYTFSTLPSIRNIIMHLIPGAHPANIINVRYDTKSDFNSYLKKLQFYLYPALLGIENYSDLKKFDEILFVDTQTDRTLLKVKPNDEKI